MASHFRKKPVVIEAMQHTGPGTHASVAMWCHGIPTGDGAIVISTLEGAMKAEAGDWVIKGTRGEFYPCKPGPFEDTFEPVLMLNG